MKVCKTCTNEVFGREVFCKTCRAERHKYQNHIYIQKNLLNIRKKNAEFEKKWRESNPDIEIQRRKKNSAKRILVLSNSYVSGQLGVKVNQVPIELIQFKREKILLNRALRELFKTLKEMQK